jgi:transposase
MPGSAARVIVTERQQDLLLQMSQSVTIAFRLRQRARIVLLAFEGRSNQDIAREVELGREQVGVWRRRWQNEFERLTLIEGLEALSDLRHAIEDVLADEPRSGRPCTFTAEQLAMIFSVACEAVEDSGRPVARWTQREIIDEVVQRGIVSSLSTSHLSTLLAEAHLQPHKSRYWLNTKEKDPEIFQAQAKLVCDCYLEAPECDAYTMCIDEMTSIQALERIAPTKPMAPGQRELIEFEYLRHGTQCLIASFDVVTGQSVAPTVGDTRTEEDFLEHCKRTVELHPESQWRLIVDQLNTHCSASLVLWVIAVEGLQLTEDEVGIKGKSGILKSQETRKTFLSSPDRRIRFIYVPKHSSWLNQVEIWFSVVVRRVLKRGNFPSVEALRERLLEFIDYYNRTMAKPYRWTYTGQPLAV